MMNYEYKLRIEPFFNLYAVLETKGNVSTVLKYVLDEHDAEKYIDSLN